MDSPSSESAARGDSVVDATTAVDASSSSNSPPAQVASTAVNASSSTNSPPARESPFSSYVNSLSPLNLANATRLSQVFPALGSPPLIFATPRVNPIHEAGLSMSSGKTQVSKEEENRDHEKDDRESHESFDWRKSAIHIDACLRFSHGDACAENCEQLQSSGSSEHIDKYLVDNVEGDSTFSDNSVVQKVKQSGNACQLSQNNLDTATGEIPELEKERGRQAGSEADVKEHVAFDSRQGERREEETKIETVEKRKCNNCSAELQDKCICSDFQTEKIGYGEECDFPSEMPSEHVQTSLAPGDPNSNIELISSRPTNNTMLESRVYQQQRGISRRCLQFEAAQTKATFIANRPLKVAAAGASSEIDAFDSNLSSGSKQLTIANPTMTNISCPITKIKQVVPLSKPSGIGLHLNSIIKAASLHHDANASIRLVDDSMSVVEIRSKASSPLAITTSKSHQEVEDLESMQTIDYQATPMSLFAPEHLDNSEKLSQLSPRKKKKLSSSPDDDLCKQCNCKKTKCLKLYCDCFAAGIYCDESCSCHGCLNKPEHVDTVLQTRQQIISRNPLAFSPKIIQCDSEISMNNMLQESGNLTTPASARHKRGCNCKKSMCLKNYCECYQGGVGCSAVCGCKNCKNIYGKKDDYSSEEMVVSWKGSMRAEMRHLHRLTPATLSIQHSDQGKDKGALESQIIIRRNHPTPGLAIRSLRNSDEDNTTLATSIEVPEMSPYDRETDHSNMEILRYFSSRFSELDDASTLTPFPDLLPTPISSSASSLCISPPKLDSISRIYEDDTPEFLKDALTTTMKPVEVNSPSRKRVSPSQRRLSESCSSSSGRLQSGREFIFRALPPLPPLTPCTAPESQQDSDDLDPEEKK